MQADHATTHQQSGQGQTGSSQTQQSSQGSAGSHVHVTVEDHDGTVMGQFLADRHQSLLESAEGAGIDIGYSCRSGACYSCMCKVQKGLEGVDIGQFGVPLIDLEDEEDVLTCVAGIRDERWLDGQDHEIVIKKV